MLRSLNEDTKLERPVNIDLDTTITITIPGYVLSHGQDRPSRGGDAVQKEQVMELSDPTTNGAGLSSAVLPHPIVNSGGQLNNLLEEEAAQTSPSSMIKEPSTSVQKIRLNHLQEFSARSAD
eukprot:g39890.t1